MVLGGILGLALFTSIGTTAAAEPVPYLGAPLTIPGRFEAEHYDLGGEGVAYHGLDPLRWITNAILWERQLYRRQAGEDLALDRVGTGFHVIVRGGEWLNYTMHCEKEGYYSVQLSTKGPPSTWHNPSSCENPVLSFGTVRFHIELDSHDVSGPTDGTTNSATTRIWISAGPHQLRLVVDAVSHLDDGGSVCGWASGEDPWWLFSYSVDWIQVVPAATQLGLTDLAGGLTGFLDGQGSEARFAPNPELIGESPNGDLVVQDTANSAFRLMSRNGLVRTLAGHLGNPVRDGQGTNAGFGKILQTLVIPEGFLLVLETWASIERIRQVDWSGKVSTLYAGRPTAQLPEFANPPLTRTVALAQIIWSDSNRLEALSAPIPDYMWWSTPGTGNPPELVTGLALFHIANGRAVEIPIGALPPPPPDRTKLGGGFRITGSNRLVQESPAGFSQQVLPGVELSSGLLATDGTLFGVREKSVSSRIYRLVPDLALFVHVSGNGSVAGVPGTSVPPDQEIRLQATPGSRFTEFTGWSDGNTDNPRVLRLSQDTVLTARFEQRLPFPNGIIPGSQELGNDRRLRFRLFGSAAPYHYRLQASGDLRQWTGPLPGTETLSGSGILNGDIIETRGNETWLAVPAASEQHYFRVQLLDE